MTPPDQVIWQHPDTEQYFTTPYTVGADGAITFGQPVAVDRAYVVQPAGQTEKESNTMDKEEQAKLQKEHADALAAKDTQIAQLQKERDDLAAAQENVRLQKEEESWSNLKKTMIPPAMVKDPKDEVDLRKLCKEDPATFAQKILEKRAPGSKLEGQPHTQGPADEEDPLAAQNRILGQRMRVPGTLH
jgi:hypothetical protein